MTQNHKDLFGSSFRIRVFYIRWYRLHHENHNVTNFQGRAWNSSKFWYYFKGLRHRVCIRRNQTVHGNRDVTVTFKVTRVLHVIFVIIYAFLGCDYGGIDNKIGDVSFVSEEIRLVTDCVTYVTQISCHAWNYETTKLWDHETMRLWNYKTIILWIYGTETEIESETETESMKLWNFETETMKVLNNETMNWKWNWNETETETMKLWNYETM